MSVQIVELLTHMNSYILISDVSGTGFPGLSAGADMERAEGDTGRKFNPQIS